MVLHKSVAGEGPTAGPEGPLLARLNARGLRLVMLADALVLYGLAVLIMFYRFGTTWPSYPVTAYLVSFTVAVAVFVITLYFGGLYEREPRLGAPPVLPRVAGQTLVAGGLVALLTLALTGAAREMGLTTARALPIPILNLAILMVLGAGGVAMNRGLVHVVRTRREGPPDVLVVGEGSELELARRHLAEDESRATVVGYVSAADDLLGAAAETGATDVVLLDSQWIEPLYPHVLAELERAGVTVLVRVSALETLFGLQRVREVGGLPLVLLRAQTMPRSRARLKRLFDLSILALGAPFWLPILCAVAVYQAVFTGRPLLYWQPRVGTGGRVFSMVKFRTMRVDAEAAGGAQLAERDDPRVIPACRWVRSSRLDELPQIYNVLRGEMSLVGPRPERPELTGEFERRIPGYERRHEVPPGLTGLAQIHGRYHTDAAYKLGYDLQYLVNWSPVLDLEILFRTLWVVLTRRL